MTPPFRVTGLDRRKPTEAHKDASAEDRLKIYQAACAERVGREIELIFPATIRSDTLELLSTVARLSRWEIRALCQLAKTFENRPVEEAL